MPGPNPDDAAVIPSAVGGFQADAWSEPYFCEGDVYVQVDGAPVFVTTGSADPAADLDRGLFLATGQIVEFRAWTVLRFRATGSPLHASVVVERKFNP